MLGQRGGTERVFFAKIYTDRSNLAHKLPFCYAFRSVILDLDCAVLSFVQRCFMLVFVFR